MTRWAVQLPKDQSYAAADLRLEAGIEVLERDDSIWLRGEAADERLHRLLLQLPDARRFEVLAGDELRPVDSRLPKGRLPQGSWTKLKSWATVALPPAALAAQFSARVPLQLVRIADDMAANVLLTNMDDWLNFATSTSQLRLAPLRFAASHDGRVVVQGSPLPPLPGTRVYEQAAVAVPCGWGWSPRVDHETLRESWNVGKHDLALVNTDGSWEHIREDQFVQASRSAVRESAIAEQE